MDILFSKEIFPNMSHLKSHVILFCIRNWIKQGLELKKSSWKLFIVLNVNQLELYGIIRYSQNVTEFLRKNNKFIAVQLIINDGV